MGKRLTQPEIEAEFLDLLQLMDEKLRYLAAQGAPYAEFHKTMAGMIHTILITAMASAPPSLRENLWDYTGVLVACLGQESFEDGDDMAAFLQGNT